MLPKRSSNMNEPQYMIIYDNHEFSGNFAHNMLWHRYNQLKYSSLQICLFCEVIWIYCSIVYANLNNYFAIFRAVYQI